MQSGIRLKHLPRYILNLPRWHGVKRQGNKCFLGEKGKTTFAKQKNRTAVVFMLSALFPKPSARFLLHRGVPRNTFLIRKKNRF